MKSRRIKITKYNIEATINYLERNNYLWASGDKPGECDHLIIPGHYLFLCDHIITYMKVAYITERELNESVDFKPPLDGFDIE